MVRQGLGVEGRQELALGGNNRAQALQGRMGGEAWVDP